jgi:hypothetical protein
MPTNRSKSSTVVVANSCRLPSADWATAPLDRIADGVPAAPMAMASLVRERREKRAPRLVDPLGDDLST